MNRLTRRLETLEAKHGTGHAHHKAVIFSRDEAGTYRDAGGHALPDAAERERLKLFAILLTSPHDTAEA